MSDDPDEDIHDRALDDLFDLPDDMPEALRNQAQEQYRLWREWFLGPEHDQEENDDGNDPSSYPKYED